MTTFRLATESDDAVLRCLLRENAMSTWVDMALEREPSFFAAAHSFGREWAVLAEDAGEPVGMYTASELPVYLDGRVALAGYLGGLRVRRSFRGRLRNLRDGFATIRSLAPYGTAPATWFTIIATENRTARRLLERGVPGLPTYRLLNDYVTYTVATSWAKPTGLWRQAGETDIPGMLDLHCSHAQQFQFSPALDEEAVSRLGLAKFFVSTREGRVRAMAALWDQTELRQVVARRYRRPFRSLIPLYNVLSPWLRTVRLPREGGVLRHTFMAFLALSQNAFPDAPSLLRDLLAHCATPAATLGLHAAHPLAPVVRRLRPLRYPARVYAVEVESPSALAGRPAQPEAALL